MILCNDSGLNVYSISNLPFLLLYEIEEIIQRQISEEERAISARKLKILAPLYSFHQNFHVPCMEFSIGG